MISLGFSFEDQHILDITRRALRNPTATLFILSHSHENATGFEEKFEQQRNVVVVRPKPEEHFTLRDLNTLLEHIVPNQQIN